MVRSEVELRPSIFRAYALKKGAASATNNAAPIKATGGVTPVAVLLPKEPSHVLFVAGL
jgi:hypothetical protein